MFQIIFFSCAGAFLIFIIASSIYGYFSAVREMDKADESFERIKADREEKQAAHDCLVHKLWTAVAKGEHEKARSLWIDVISSSLVNIQEARKDIEHLTRMNEMLENYKNKNT